MKNCRIDNIDYNVPENYDELSKEQLLFFIENFYVHVPRLFMEVDVDKVLQSENVSNINYTAFMQVQVWNLIRMPYDTFTSIDDEGIYFLMEEMHIGKFLLEASTLTKNHFPKINGLAGPLDDFADMTAGEYLWTDVFYRDYKNGNEHALNALVATLYRPKRNGIKIPFNHLDIESREQLILGIPIAHKLAILLYYEGCMKAQHDAYPQAFEGGGSDNTHYNELLLQVAKDGPFGDYDKVCNTNFHLINQEMVRLKKEADALEEKLKQR